MTRPRTRGDCVDVPRPCPYVGCRYNTYLDVTQQNKVRLPMYEPEEANPETSCALDMAEEGEQTQARIAEALGVTELRVWHIIEDSLVKLSHSGNLRELYAEAWAEAFGPVEPSR